MRVAFAIFKFFPHGGAARDLGKLVAACRQRHHEVRVYAMQWQGPRLAGVETVELATRGIRSHVRQRRFALRVAEHVAGSPVDVLVGLNKLPGLDVYYAADSCFEEKARTQRPWPYRLTSRYRHYAQFERAVFAEHGQTRILTIAPNQEAIFRALYRTPAHRFHRLPPGIERDRAFAPAPAVQALRQEIRIRDGETMLLFVGSGFVKKGLDRVLRGVAALPRDLRECLRLFVVGADKAGRFQSLARRLGIAGRVHFVGGRDDVPVWLHAADALVLPAYDEAAGMAALEGAISGLPVLVTANCGYAPFVEAANAGIVTPVPFDQRRFNKDLERLLAADERPNWSTAGRAMANDESLFGMASEAVDFLEHFAAGRERLSVAFCAFSYTPADPHYRPLIPVALACRRRGMDIRVYVGDWQGTAPAGIDIVTVPVAAITESTRFERWQHWVMAALDRAPAGCVVGFEPMSGLDILYGAEPTSLATRLGEANAPLFHLLSGDGGTLGELPPGLGTRPAPPGASRATLRALWGFGADDVVFAMAGGDLVRHGFERLLAALGRLPEPLREHCRVLAVGRLSHGFAAVAGALKLRGRVQVDAGIPARDAIEAADVLVELAYQPMSNGWLFDALAAGRPVVTHDAVAEARMARQADAGIVLPAPFRQEDLNRSLVDIVSSPARRRQWGENAGRYAVAPELHGQAERVAATIETRMQRGRVDANLSA